MSIDWNEVDRALSPVKDYDDLCRRLQRSFAYPFVSKAYDFSLPQLANYTERLLGGDARGRYTAYTARLVGILNALHRAGVLTVLDLVARSATRAQLQEFTDQSGIPVQDTVTVLKYLIYWVIPMEKPVAGLVRDDPAVSQALKALRDLGIRTNLDLLQQGTTAAGRRALAVASGLPEPMILELVNRADFSRMPWASKATISNIVGAGYGSVAALAGADPERLYADFFRYGEAIGKNLKLGNEIENSYRIARIVPPLIQED
jgi:hypothetical protein